MESLPTLIASPLGVGLCPSPSRATQTGTKDLSAPVILTGPSTTLEIPETTPSSGPGVSCPVPRPVQTILPRRGLLPSGFQPLKSTFLSTGGDRSVTPPPLTTRNQNYSSL